MRKKHRIIITIVLLVVAALCVVGVLMFHFLQNNPGLQSISVSEKTSGELSLRVGYVDSRGYSTRIMDEEDQEYVGDYLVDYDQSLGKYRVEIAFYDTVAAEKFCKQYTPGKTYELTKFPGDSQNPLKFKGVYTPGHKFILYIGSDVPLEIKEQAFTELVLPIGTLNFTIKANNS